MGENLEHSSIKITEEKLPMWVLNGICQQKEDDKSWFVKKLRQYLGKLVTCNDDTLRTYAFKGTKSNERTTSQFRRNRIVRNCGSSAPFAVNQRVLF